MEKKGGLQLTPEQWAGFQQYVDWEMQRKIVTFRELNREVQKGGIVFTGDSITERYPVHEMLPRDLLIYNRGIGGITSKQLLEHLDVHILTLMPRKLFLLIGTNDLGQNWGIEETAGRIARICQLVSEQCAQPEIYLSSVCPVYPSPDNDSIVGLRKNGIIQELNRLIRKEAGAVKGVVYLDIFRELADESGGLRPDYTADGLHLNIEGYRVVRDVYLPYLYH